jgi:hypothetical protein
MTDFRSLCAELLQELEHASAWDYQKALKDQARAALAQPEPQGPTDEALMTAARDAVDAYPRCSELPYFMSPESDEYEPLLLALRAAACLGSPAIKPQKITDEDLLQLAQRNNIAEVRPDGTVLYPWQGSQDMRTDVLSFARAVLARWGRPTIRRALEQLPDNN